MSFHTFVLSYGEAFDGILKFLNFLIVLTDYGSFSTDYEYTILVDFIVIGMLPTCQFLPPQTKWPQHQYSVSSSDG